MKSSEIYENQWKSSQLGSSKGFFRGNISAAQAANPQPLKSWNLMRSHEILRNTYKSMKMHEIHEISWNPRKSMKIDEKATSWNRVKSRNRAIESSNHRVLERSAAEAVAWKSYHHITSTADLSKESQQLSRYSWQLISNDKLNREPHHMIDLNRCSQQQISKDNPIWWDQDII